jgi:hypothetical protein
MADRCFGACCSAKMEVSDAWLQVPDDIKAALGKKGVSSGETIINHMKLIPGGRSPVIEFIEVYGLNPAQATALATMFRTPGVPPPPRTALCEGT